MKLDFDIFLEAWCFTNAFFIFYGGDYIGALQPLMLGLIIDYIRHLPIKPTWWGLTHL